MCIGYLKENRKNREIIKEEDSKSKAEVESFSHPRFEKMEKRIGEKEWKRKRRMVNQNRETRDNVHSHENIKKSTQIIERDKRQTKQ